MNSQMSPPPINDESLTTVADFASLLQDKKIASLAERFEKHRQRQEETQKNIGFNLFELISDHYYRETFHSDIIYALLNPDGKHQEKDKYLRLFLNYLCCQHGATIDLSHYSNAEVVKEDSWQDGRIDILIKGPEHAIIIENKINGAGDEKKQLPRYLKKVKGDGYCCDAIIYLRLNGYTPPDMTDWVDSECDQDLINELSEKPVGKLVVICAYNDTEKDLLNGWIFKCQRESNNNSDAQHILRQYGKIIQKLGGNIMNKPIMEDFFNTVIKHEGNYKTALSLRKMLDQQVAYGMERIIDKFQTNYAPFQKPIPHENGAVFRQVKYGESELHLSIWLEPWSSSPERYLIVFRDLNDDAGITRKAERLLAEIGYSEEYHASNEHGFFHMRRGNFTFPSQEDDLLAHIRDFNEKLNKLINPNSAPDL